LLKTILDIEMFTATINILIGYKYHWRYGNQCVKY